MSTPALAGPVLLSSAFNADFTANQSLWAGGPSAGLNESGRTPGSVGAYYSVKADTGTVNASQSAGIVASYLSELTAGTPAQITLDFAGDPASSVVEARFGAAAEAGVFLDIAGCLGVLVLGNCAGIPYDIDQDIAIIDRGFFLNPVTIHTAVIDTQRSAQHADQAFGVGVLNTPLGSLGPTMNLDLEQRIFFTPTGLSGTAFYRNVTTGATGSTPFLVPGDGPFALSLALGVGTWQVSFLDLALENTFRNDIDLELRPALDYVVGSWPPPGSGPLGFGLVDDTFALDFNRIQSLGTIQFEVVAAAPAPVSEPASLALLGVALSSAAVARRRRNVLRNHAAPPRSPQRPPRAA